MGYREGWVFKYLYRLYRLVVIFFFWPGEKISTRRFAVSSDEKIVKKITQSFVHKGSAARNAAGRFLRR